MTTGISITVNARDISDLAAQLLDLHHRFNGIAALQVVAPADNVNYDHKIETPTPLEEAIDRSKQQAEGGLVAPPAPPAPVKRGRKPAEPKPAVAQPKDRFFDDEPAEGSKTVTPAQAAAPEADEATEQPYWADMPPEDLFLQVRAKAKLYMDSQPEGKGPDALRKAWGDNWAKIMPDKASETPALKHLEGNRDAIIRALLIFDQLNNIDLITGEETLTDPAEDLL